MKKTRVERRAIREKKYELKLIANTSFSDLMETSAAHVKKMKKIKALTSKPNKRLPK